VDWFASNAHGPSPDREVRLCIASLSTDASLPA